MTAYIGQGPYSKAYMAKGCEGLYGFYMIYIIWPYETIHLVKSRKDCQLILKPRVRFMLSLNSSQNNLQLEVARTKCCSISVSFLWQESSFTNYKFTGIFKSSSWGSSLYTIWSISLSRSSSSVSSKTYNMELFCIDSSPLITGPNRSVDAWIEGLKFNVVTKKVAHSFLNSNLF